MRIARTILGLLLIGIGALAVTAGVIGVTAFGTNGTLEVTSSRLSTDRDAYALVADVQGISTGFPGSEALGTTTIGATGVNGKRLFVGLGTGKEVNDYLFGVPFEAVRQNGTAWQTLPVPGVEKPPVPGDQDIWLRESTGPAPSFQYAGGTGTSTLVIMNADGGRGVTASIRISYVSGTIFPLSVAALVVGAALAVIGLFVVFRQARRKRADQADTPDAAHVVPARIAPDAATQPTPVQRTGEDPAPGDAAGDAADARDPAEAPAEPVTVDVTRHRDRAVDVHPPADPEALPDEWFRRTDASS